MRVFKKKPLFGLEQLNNVTISGDEINYKIIYENIKKYLVFRISITMNLKDRLAYLDVLDYMERIQLEAGKK